MHWKLVYHSWSSTMNPCDFDDHLTSPTLAPPWSWHFCGQQKSDESPWNVARSTKALKDNVMVPFGDPHLKETEMCQILWDWIDMKFDMDIDVPIRINHKNSGHPMTFLLTHHQVQIWIWTVLWFMTGYQQTCNILISLSCSLLLKS